MPILASEAFLAQEGVLALESGVQGAILGGEITFCYWIFCFHVVKPLMPILVSLPMLSVCENNVSVGRRDWDWDLKETCYYVQCLLKTAAH